MPELDANSHCNLAVSSLFLDRFQFESRGNSLGDVIAKASSSRSRSRLACSMSLRSLAGLVNLSANGRICTGCRQFA
jgi:hypothetical protein